MTINMYYMFTIRNGGQKQGKYQKIIIILINLLIYLYLYFNRFANYFVLPTRPERALVT